MISIEPREYMGAAAAFFTAGMRVFAANERINVAFIGVDGRVQITSMSF